MSLLSRAFDDKIRLTHHDHPVSGRHLRISSSGHPCLKFHALMAQGAPQEHSAETLRAFRRGTLLEAIVIEELKWLGWEISYQQERVSVGEPAVLKGRIDALGSHPEFTGGKRVLLEVKVTSGSSPRTIEDLRASHEWYMRGYEDQGQSYLGGLNEHGIEIEDCWLVFFNPSAWQPNELIMPYDPPKVESIKSFASNVLDQIDAGGEIPRHEEWRICANCCYYPICSPAVLDTSNPPISEDPEHVAIMLRREQILTDMEPLKALDKDYDLVQKQVKGIRGNYELVVVTSPGAEWSVGSTKSGALQVKRIR